MLARLDLRDDDLVRQIHQRMVLVGIGPPAPIENIDAIQHLATKLDRIDRTAAIPIVRRQLCMAADAVDDDAPPQDAMAQGSDPVGGRLGHDAGVGAIAAIDHRERTHAADLLVDDSGEKRRRRIARGQSP